MSVLCCEVDCRVLMSALVSVLFWLCVLILVCVFLFLCVSLWFLVVAFSGFVFLSSVLVFSVCVC